MPTPGIRSSAVRVVAHVRSLARLERELARYELGRKGATVGAGAGLAAAALGLIPYAVAFGLAAAAAALALVLDVWLALLVMFAALLLVLLALALVARSLIRRGTPLTPQQAIEEARLTTRLLRGKRAG